MLLRLEAFERSLHGLRCGFVAIAEHVLQPRNPQVGQLLAECCDVGNAVAAVGHVAEAIPAHQCQQGGQYKHDAKAEGQLHVDADVCKPAVHSISPESVNI